MQNKLNEDLKIEIISIIIIIIAKFVSDVKIVLIKMNGDLQGF